MKWSPWYQERCPFLCCLKRTKISHQSEADERRIEGEKIGVKSWGTEQVSVICSLGAWCQPYNSDLDSHKRQNSFELHMLDCALQVNPGSAVTSPWRRGDGAHRPSPATRLSARRFIRPVDWWISFEYIASDMFRDEGTICILRIDIRDPVTG